jgi:hypothetical protein
MIEAPDGSIATYDAQRTKAVYSEIDAVADCSCLYCRNYRAAWNQDYFEIGLLAACAQIGIDPAKGSEMSAFGFAGGLLPYVGQFPFFGRVTRDRVFLNQFYPWFFVPNAYGSARFAEGLASIEFFVKVPWVLSEPNPDPTS